MWKVTDGEQGVNEIEPWLLNIQVCTHDSYTLATMFYVPFKTLSFRVRVFVSFCARLFPVTLGYLIVTYFRGT